jgi:DNA polymerase-3 subunit delta
MPAKSQPPLQLVCGSEEYLVKENARRLAAALAPKGGGDFAVEIVDGMAANADEAVKAIYKTLDALNTLGFFASEKLVWLKDASFLGTDRTSEAKDVVAAVGNLAETLKKGLPAGVTLLVSAGPVDKRRAFYKAFEKLGAVQVHDAIDPTRDRDWQDKVSDFISAHAKALDKAVSDDGVALLIELNGANLRQIETELEKLATYIGQRHTIEAADVRAVGSASRDAITWDLNDAVGERDLPRALRIMDRLLFQGEEPIGLLFALASRIRQMLILRELIDRKALRPDNYPGVQAQLNRIPASVASQLPADKKLNPLLAHPFVVFKTLSQAARYTRPQLVRAMEWLLDTNRQLVTSALPKQLALEELVARIVTAK